PGARRFGGHKDDGSIVWSNCIVEDCKGHPCDLASPPLEPRPVDIDVPGRLVSLSCRSPRSPVTCLICGCVCRGLGPLFGIARIAVLALQHDRVDLRRSITIPGSETSTLIPDKEEL